MNKTESVKYYDLDNVQWKFVDMLNELEDRVIDYNISNFDMDKHRYKGEMFSDLQKFFQHHRIKGV